MSGVSTTDRAPITVTGAMMSGSAIPATLPYSAVARAASMPPATSLEGMTSAVREAEREESMRTAERGRVAVTSSLPPRGRASLPPDLK